MLGHLRCEALLVRAALGEGLKGGIGHDAPRHMRDHLLTVFRK